MTKFFLRKSLRVPCMALALFVSASGLLAQDSRATGANLPMVVNSNSQFAIDLYRQINADPGTENIFVSPYSISTALAMTYAGSRSNTRKQMADVSHFNLSDENLQEGFSALQAEIKTAASDKFRLDVANALWGEKDYHFDPAFASVINRYYGGGFHSVDFIGDAEGSRKKINQSVADSTEGNIQQLVSEGDINKLTRLVLTKAIYFKGNWATKFNARQTKDEPFTLSNAKIVNTPMMEQTGYFPFVREPGMIAVELPYAGYVLSMIVVLPDGDINKLGDSLSAETIQRIRKKMQAQIVGKVNVFLPRFTFESRYYLEQTLTRMGMPDAFDKNNADFSGIDGGRDLYLAHVIHQARIEVDEEGSEATAATAVTTFVATAAREVSPEQTFRADRPFLFVIVHNATRSILFMGRMSNPAGAAAGMRK